MNTQKRFLSYTDDVAKTYGLEQIVDQTYSNVGRVRFMRPGSFAPVAEFGFTFDGQAQFSGIFLGTELGHNTCFYSEGQMMRGFHYEELDVAMDFIVKTLAASKREVKA